MASFPKDPPLRKVLAAFVLLGFRVVREGNHIALVRENDDGSRTPMTLPNHPKIKAGTLQSACRQAGIDRDTFLDAYEGRHEH
jgi:predicted RNA binding protein YcfA (HicA-like mRNA interferase family)